MKKYFFIILCLIPCISEAQIFRAGITAGGTFAQIEGDEVAGYYKLGFQAGVLSDMYLSEKFTLGLEILYSQRGSTNAWDAGQYLDDFKIKMDYVEVPVLAKYHDDRGMTFFAGVSGAKLISAVRINQNIEDFSFFEDTANPTRQWDFSGIVGIAYNINDVFAMSLRLNRSFVYIRQYAFSNFQNKGMYHNAVSLRAEFLFYGIKE